MSVHADHPRRVCFRPYEFDMISGELRKCGMRLRAQRQQLEVLRALLERAGQVVTREELRERLWPTGLHVEFEQNLNRSVNKLRDLLSDDASQPKYIETLHGRGYRFIGKLATTEENRYGDLGCSSHLANADGSSHAPLEMREDLVEQTPAHPDIPLRLAASWIPIGSLRLRRKALSISAVSLGLIFLGVFARMKTARNPKPMNASTAQVRIAVLPFANMTGDEGEQFLCDGLTDEMIAQLGRLQPERLSVIAPSSAMHFKSDTSRLDGLAAALHLDYLLSGTVRKSGDKMRITTALIRSSDQSYVWTGEFDRSIGDILDVQRGVALAVASETHLVLTEQRSAALMSSHRVNGPAYREYLKGRFYWDRRDKASLLEAISHFENALATDPTMARAFAGIADSYLVLGAGYLPSHETYGKGRLAAKKAIELDPQLAEAHTSLGYLDFIDAWDWEGADREFKKAIEINGAYATAHHWYALYLAGMARYPEAIAEIETALSLDPMSIIINSNAASIYCQAGQYDKATAQFRKALGIEPNLAQAHGGLGLVYELRGQYSEALAEFKKAQLLNGTIVQYAGDVARTYALAGDRGNARQTLVQLLAVSSKTHVPRYNLALCYLALGKTDQSFQHLKRGMQEREFAVTDLVTDPRLSALRSDARFAALRHEAGL